ncbi:hypothetical protein PRIPAC_78716 [Pristionchus pacificus]|uniref:Nuclear receptor n=1 Tax=Pristionchus pacificus TaxID=54126 RepID=A0A2A6CJZ4_PRIPA|nr:hypothetical protein PRIPAC_78716 [Pristionchus pacificus]|eukprot:PDM78341.1 nuclear receptor [Pristionchus pacificus]
MLDNKCRVCEAETDVFHYGIGACRACAVFFRRTRARKTPFVCKNGQKCASEGNHLCKRCRFDQIELLFGQKRTKRAVKKTAKEAREAIATASTSGQSEIIVNPSVIGRGTQTEDYSILEKLRQAYKMVCTIRRTTELAMRTGDQAVQPMNIVTGNYDLIPSTIEFMNEGSRILSTALIEFALSSFSEFSAFSQDEQWLFVRTFLKPFHITDSGYRSIPAFGEKWTRHFTGYTRFMDVEYIEQYTTATGTVLLEDAIRMSQRHHEKNIKPARIAFARFAASEEEMLAMLGLLFWNIDLDQIFRQEVLDISEEYRTRILTDLRKYYARVNYAEYGKRIGEMLCLCNLVLAKVSINKHTFEVARLVNVFSADSFAYNMQRNF